MVQESKRRSSVPSDQGVCRLRENLTRPAELAPPNLTGLSFTNSRSSLSVRKSQHHANPPLSSVESLTPHPSHEPDDHHDYAHLLTHTRPGSPHHHHHHHAEDALPRTASHESTTSTTIFDAEQEAQLGGPAKGRFALRKASTSDDSPWINDSSADNERGQPFGGSIPPSAHVPIHPAGHTETDLPPHLRQNSRTALFPSSLHRHRDSNTSADRCQEALGGASGRGVAGLNATLGLVIHAMADGVALGASSLSGSGGLGLVVFLAVIVHKGARPQHTPGI